MSENRVPLVAGGVLVLGLVIGSIVAESGKPASPVVPVSPPESARALVLPADLPHTVLVAPCNTPASSTARNAEGEAPPGATLLEVPRGRGFRTLLVPHCQPSDTGTMDVPGDFPSAAFVVPASERVIQDQYGKIMVDGIVADSQLTLLDGSSASTIVVPPCTERQAGKGKDVVLDRDGRSDVVTAPTC